MSCSQVVPTSELWPCMPSAPALRPTWRPPMANSLPGQWTAHVTGPTGRWCSGAEGAAHCGRPSRIDGQFAGLRLGTRAEYLLG